MGNQPTLFEPPPAQTPYREPPEPVYATWSSICPLCSRFISKNHSRVVSLPYAINPRSSPDYRRSLDDGLLYYSSGQAIYTNAKRWAHHYCWSKFFRQPRYEALRVGESRYYHYHLVDRRDENLHYIYRFYDTGARLLYVGVTYDFQQRVNQHYQARSLDQLAQIHRITTQEYATRSEALNAEREAIQTEHPLWNVAR